MIDLGLKKNDFMQGAFIATIGIVISKILGIIYVIPFYQIIGEQGGALYGYAYNIYALFLGISQAGIPLAMSKITSEYNTLGYFKAKRKAFKIGKWSLTILGVVSFLLLFFFAPQFAKLILGDIKGGNTIEDVTYVVRIISTAILVVPILSVTRGYLQGHKYITPTSISQVIEQLIRVIIIVLGSYVALRMFNQSLTTTVGVAVFSATVGALLSYVYLLRVLSKNKKNIEEVVEDSEEPDIKGAEIVKKIFMYALPFIMIDVVNAMYNSVDVITLVKILVNDYGYTMQYAESIMSVISTWGAKLNMIIASVNTGIIVSLIPNITASFVKNDMKEVRHKINQSLQMLLFLVVPMVAGLSFLAGPVWTVFYGSGAALSYGTTAYAYFVFIALAMALYTSTITIIQILKEYKAVLLLLLSGLVLKIACNVPLIFLFDKLGLPAYYGAFTATILGDIGPAILAIIYLYKKYDVNFGETFKKLGKILVSCLAMVAVLFLLTFIVPINLTSRLKNVVVIVIYMLVGIAVYFGINYKFGNIHDVFGKGNVDKIINKIFRRKKKLLEK